MIQHGLTQLGRVEGLPFAEQGLHNELDETCWNGGNERDVVKETKLNVFSP